MSQLPYHSVQLRSAFFRQTRRAYQPLLLAACILGLLLSNRSAVRAADTLHQRVRADQLARSASSVPGAHTQHRRGCSMTIAVTSAADSGDGSLRQALDDICFGGTVTFADSFSIYLDSGLSLASTVTIDGSGQSIIISGDSGNDGSSDLRPFTIEATAAVTLTNLTIVDGSAGDGGAIFSNGRLLVSQTTFANNQAGGSGGAIYTGAGTVTISQTTFRANTSGINGGAIWIENTQGLITNTTFANNSSNNGGGLMLFDAGATLTHTTFSGNSATNGASIRIVGNIRLSNSIIANGTGDEECVNNGNLVVNDNNLIEDESCSATFSGDPLLSALGDYDGSTQTFAPLPGSPAIDAGAAPACPASDQRGITRPIGTDCDLGAVESRGFTLALISGDNQTTDAGTAFSAPLVVAVTAIAANEPVGPGGVITFSGPTSGASIAPATATSDIGGVSSVSVSANSIAGSYIVTATARGVSTPVPFHLSQTAVIRTVFLPLLVR